MPEWQADPYYLKTQQELLPAGQRFLAGEPGFDLPSYGVSPYYERGQEALAPLGEDILAGKPPEWLRGIGVAGGPEFEEMMKLTRRDVTRTVQEDIAKRGIGRGGIGTTAIAKTMGDIGVKARWEDYTRSIVGKKALLTAGVGIMGGVRTAGLQEQQLANVFGLSKAEIQLSIRKTGMEVLQQVRSGALSEEQLRNQFGLSVAELEFKVQKANEEIAMREKEAKAGMWGDIISGGLGLVGTIGGAMIGGPAGAAIGGSIGSSIGRGAADTIGSGRTTGTVRFPGI